MSESKQKIIPKFKKKLHGFLSDESGKITKEDVLKMGMIAMGVAGMIGTTESAYAWHDNSCTLEGASNGTFGDIQSNPVDRVVNGHVNYLQGAVGIQGSPGHSNGQYVAFTNVHGNHGNHGSGGWC